MYTMIKNGFKKVYYNLLGTKLMSIQNVFQFTFK